jgi:predicted enzyme related to lactoylglutathione lyase
MAYTPASVIWFEIWVADLERAESFYAGLLGWAFRPFEEYDPVNYHIVATPEGTLGGALVRAQSSPEHGTKDGRGTVVYAAVDDVGVAVDQARSLGGSVVQAARVIGSADGWFAIVGDPDGNRVGLWSEKAPRARTNQATRGATLARPDEMQPADQEMT